jgi:dihydrodipicolinate synthase/N-acetylneuraminate lyase
MKTTHVTVQDLCGVFAVPPLARRRDIRHSLDDAENERVLRHIVNGGITRVLYGGNAFLYHATLAEYAHLLDWLAAVPGDAWLIPSIGPSYGRALDQAPLVRRHRFPTAMLLPCSDPRDAAGLHRGVSDIVDALGTPIVVYLKEERTFGSEIAAGVDAIASLVDAGLVCAIKYAIVRNDASVDPYLDELLARVDRTYVVSGMGERPAIVHLREKLLPGFTTGSGCVAPGLSAGIFEAAQSGQWEIAESLRQVFMPLEDHRDAWGPARVLHAAVDGVGIATMGRIPPFVSELSEPQRTAVIETAMTLAQTSRGIARA